MPECEEVQGRLGHADVRFDAHYDDGEVRGRVRGELGGQFGHEHGEGGFVDFGRGGRVGGEDRGDLADGCAEPGGVLRGDVDWHAEDFGWVGWMRTR